MIRSSVILSTVALVLAGTAWAQSQKDPAQIGDSGPPSAPTVTGDVCVLPGAPIPDDSPIGGTAMLVIAGGGTISAANPIEVGIEITHTWVGDLSITLTHVDTATSVIVFDRPGPGGLFCSGNDIDVLLSDSAALNVENGCNPVLVPAVNGTFQPNNPLSAFHGESFNGTWTLFVQDHEGGDVGTLDVFCLNGPLGATTTGGKPTPATSEWGMALLTALFLWAMAFFHRQGKETR